MKPVTPRPPFPPPPAPTTTPAREDLPYRRREAYEHAISSFMRPDDPHSVSLADADRFCRSAQWAKLYAALEAAFGCLEQPIRPDWTRGSLI